MGYQDGAETLASVGAPLSLREPFVRVPSGAGEARGGQGRTRRNGSVRPEGLSRISERPIAALGSLQAPLPYSRTVVLEQGKEKGPLKWAPLEVAVRLEIDPEGVRHYLVQAIRLSMPPSKVEAVVIVLCKGLIDLPRTP